MRTDGATDPVLFGRDTRTSSSEDRRPRPFRTALPHAVAASACLEQGRPVMAECQRAQVHWDRDGDTTWCRPAENPFETSYELASAAREDEAVPNRSKLGKGERRSRLVLAGLVRLDSLLIGLFIGFSTPQRLCRRRGRTRLSGGLAGESPHPTAPTPFGAAPWGRSVGAPVDASPQLCSRHPYLALPMRRDTAFEARLPGLAG